VRAAAAVAGESAKATVIEIECSYLWTVSMSGKPILSSHTNDMIIIDSRRISKQDILYCNLQIVAPISLKIER
jgi:hypothetical protein